jgi:hypothetical protein
LRFRILDEKSKEIYKILLGAEKLRKRKQRAKPNPWG